MFRRTKGAVVDWVTSYATASPALTANEPVVLPATGEFTVLGTMMVTNIVETLLALAEPAVAFAILTVTVSGPVPDVSAPTTYSDVNVQAAGIGTPTTPNTVELTSPPDTSGRYDGVLPGLNMLAPK